MLKLKINLDRHGPRPLPIICLLPGPHCTSFPSTFKELFNDTTLMQIQSGRTVPLIFRSEVLIVWVFFALNNRTSCDFFLSLFILLLLVFENNAVLLLFRKIKLVFFLFGPTDILDWRKSLKSPQKVKERNHTFNRPTWTELASRWNQTASV
jgi:hypothetical protein